MDRDDLHPLLADDRITTVGLLFEVAACLRNRVEADLDHHGITTSAFEVLIRLGRSPGHRLRMTELADQCTLSNSGLTRVIDRLLAGGLVVRERHDRDRRVFYAVLTPAGYELLLAVLPSHLEGVSEHLIDILGTEERSALEDALRKVRDALAGEAADDAVCA